MLMVKLDRRKAFVSGREADVHVMRFEEAVEIHASGDRVDLLCTGNSGVPGRADVEFICASKKSAQMLAADLQREIDYGDAVHRLY